MRSLGLAVLVAIGAVVAACGEEATDEPEPARPASIAELTGPWRPQPFTLDPVLRERIAQACRRPPMSRGPGSVLAVIDARGGGLVTVRMTGVDPGECSGIAISPDGELISAGGGSVGNQLEIAPELREFQLGALEVSGAAGSDLLPVDGLVNVFGTAGPGIATIVIEPLGKPSLVASLENGWFGAWWPVELDQKAPDGPRFPSGALDFMVRAYDENNDVVEETRNWDVLN